MSLLEASRQAWLVAPGSRHDIESTGSSVSLLQSIYGSQASQLPISEYSSEGSWGRSDLAGGRSLTSLPRRPRSRPMSSPAGALAARQERRRVLSTALAESPPSASQLSLESEERVDVSRKQEVSVGVVGRRPARPYSAAVPSRPPRPGLLARPPSARVSFRPPRAGSAAHPPTARMLARPQSAAVSSRSSSGVLIPLSRPSSAATSRRKLARPKTALGVRQRDSLALVDLEEEPEECPVPDQSIRDTAPVHLTDTPEFFNFWLGKPLQERDFGVKVHKRKPWKRPQSDYGNRLSGRKKSDSNGGGANDAGGDDSGLDALLEDDGSGRGHGRELSGERNSFDDGRDNGSGGGGENLRSSRGSSEDSSRRKSKEQGGKGRGRRKSSDKSDKDGKKICWDNSKNFSKAAEDDDYFKDFSLFKEAIDRTAWVDPAFFPNVKPTRFELPMDLSTLERMTPLQYLTAHCIVGHKIKERCAKVFQELDRDKRLKISKEKVKKGLIKVFWSLVSLDEAESVLEIVLYSENLEVNRHLFSSICCVARRVLYLYSKSSDRKELIETVDFDSLSWKFRDYNISKSLLLLFSKIE